MPTIEATREQLIAMLWEDDARTLTAMNQLHQQAQELHQQQIALNTARDLILVQLAQLGDPRALDFMSSREWLWAYMGGEYIEKMRRERGHA